MRKWVVAPLRGVHILFARFSLLGLRSVSEQRQSSRSTRHYLSGRSRIMSLCFVSAVLCHLHCPKLYTTHLASGSLETSISFNLSQAEFVWPSSSRNASLPTVQKRDLSACFFYVPDAATLSSCCLGFLSTSSNMASVGGRRRKSAEEQCAEFQSSRPPDKTEDAARRRSKTSLGGLKSCHFCCFFQIEFVICFGSSVQFLLS